MSNEAVKIQKLPPDTEEKLSLLYKGYPDGFRRFGPGGYLLPANFTAHSDALRRMRLRRDDVWVLTYPRSGTTMTQEMVWLLVNNLDYERARNIQLFERFPQIELFAMLHEQFRNPERQNLDVEIMADLESITSLRHKTAESVASPRFFKSHLALSLLPPTLLSTGRAVYVARDPRDVAVSYYHLHRLMKYHDFVGDFRAFWELFVDDAVLFTPYFSHLKEAWAQRNHPNMLFMFYEDIIKDKPAAIRRVSKFFGKEYTEDEIIKLSDHLDIKNFRMNKSVNHSRYDTLFNEGAELFIRKGKAGGWRACFDTATREQAASWLQRNLADTDLRFPSEAGDDDE